MLHKRRLSSIYVLTTGIEWYVKNLRGGKLFTPTTQLYGPNFFTDLLEQLS